MKCNIMLISKEKSFIIDSMVQELQNIGFCSCSVGFDVMEISKKQEETDVFFLFFNEFDADMTSVLVLVKDICAVYSKTLFVTGYEA